MRVKLFWKHHPWKPTAGFNKGPTFKNAQDLEDEINTWLQLKPNIKVVEIKHSASDGNLAGVLWLISVWYEVSV